MAPRLTELSSTIAARRLVAASLPRLGRVCAGALTPQRMAFPQRGETLLLPQGRPRPQTAHLATLPEDVIRHSASRLRLLALSYASVFFIAGFLSPILFHETQVHLAANPLHWVPGVVAIVVALAVAILI